MQRQFHLGFAGCLLLAACLAASAREGYVETRTGAIYEGQVRFESNAVVVANAAQGLLIRIPSSNLVVIAFREDTHPMPLSAAAGADSGARWRGEDIGSVRWSGRQEQVGGTFWVWGSGTNVLADSDSFHFVSRRVEGPSQIIARVTRVSPTDPWARAGLMMRDGLTANARNVFLSVTAARGSVFQWRERDGQDTDVRLDARAGVPCWLKLRRDRDVITACTSTTGKRWTVVDRLKVPVAAEYWVGLAVVGVNESMLNETVFEGVEEGPWLPNRWFAPQVELRSSSVQRGYIEKMDDDLIYFASRPAPRPVSRTTVANLRFQPLPPSSGAWLNAGRTGVLLASGEFIDGDCRTIADGCLVLSSVPLGLCRYDLSTEVLAAVLGKRGEARPYPCTVTTADHSTWMGSDMVVEPDGLSLREPILGIRRIPMHEVVEFRRRL